jgi:nitrous oxidase accessory protein NosD
VYSANASTAHRNVIRNNRIYDNARVGKRGPGIILSSGTGNVAYGNDVWGNNGGIQIGSGALNTKVSGNAIFRNSGYGISIGLGSIGARVEGNIIYQNDGLPIRDDGLGTVRERNWFGGETRRGRFGDVLHWLRGVVASKVLGNLGMSANSRI